MPPRRSVRRNSGTGIPGYKKGDTVEVRFDVWMPLLVLRLFVTSCGDLPEYMAKLLDIQLTTHDHNFYHNWFDPSHCIFLLGSIIDH
jgi:hypothetical protein